MLRREDAVDIEEPGVVGGFEGATDVPGVEFNDDLVILGSACLLDLQPDETEGPGTEASHSLLDSLRPKLSPVTVAPPLLHGALRE